MALGIERSPELQLTARFSAQTKAHKPLHGDLAIVLLEVGIPLALGRRAIALLCYEWLAAYPATAGATTHTVLDLDDVAKVSA